MGNFAVTRATWAKAAAYKKKMDDGKAVDRDLAMETLAGVLSGEILVHNHCYRADEMALVIDMAKEFGYKVSTFHHAVEAYKIADILAKEGICSEMWADRSEENTSELQSLMRISYVVFCLKKKKKK